ncbi:hypothetical protein L195_g040136 [Trifolium pratense]|uniref:Uncharacterized protein n=1 Tax=Trifolium pratense TaxID=57577 RepID=A0A2K3LZZ1_TRIPR|nr:hypothetical protein L195_g040136 [Trifolium pratense]
MLLLAGSELPLYFVGAAEARVWLVQRMQGSEVVLPLTLLRFRGWLQASSAGTQA